MQVSIRYFQSIVSLITQLGACPSTERSPIPFALLHHCLFPPTGERAGICMRIGGLNDKPQQKIHPG